MGMGLGAAMLGLGWGGMWRVLVVDTHTGCGVTGNGLRVRCSKMRAA